MVSFLGILFEVFPSPFFLSASSHINICNIKSYLQTHVINILSTTIHVKKYMIFFLDVF